MRHKDLSDILEEKLIKSHGFRTFWFCILKLFCNDPQVESWTILRQEQSALWTQFFPVSEGTHQRHGLMLLLPEVQQLESKLEELLPQLVPGHLIP